jgi:hypothetical protein
MTKKMTYSADTEGLPIEEQLRRMSGRTPPDSREETPRAVIWRVSRELEKEIDRIFSQN